MKRFKLLNLIVGIIIVFMSLGIIINSAVSESSKIIITPTYKTNLSADNVEKKYLKAYKISGNTLLKETIPNSTQNLLTYDDGIIAEESTNGITLTNTTTTGNLFVQIGLTETSGCFDFTSLDGITGKIGIDFQVSVAGNSGGGTYIRGYNTIVDNSTEERERVVPEQIIKKGVIISNEILETYVTNAVDNVYFKITIPKGGSIQIHNVYLYMETKVKGFAKMEQKITGGKDADINNIYNVTNADELFTAITQIKNNQIIPSIINLNGTITYDDWKTASGSSSRFIDISAGVKNLSIVGVGSSGIMDGIGFKISGENTLIQNLTVRFVEDADGI